MNLVWKDGHQSVSHRDQENQYVRAGRMNVLPQNGYKCLEISNGKSEKYIKIVDEQCCILLIDHTIQGSKQLENSTSIKNTAYTFTDFLNINFGGQLTKQ